MKILISAALIPLGALTACSNAGQRAEEEYHIVAERGTNREKCIAAGKAADAWLGLHDSAKYQEWNAMRGIYCMAADQTGQ